MVNFWDVETKSEFRLVTNLPDDRDPAVSDEEIRDIYRLRWGVELFWKFLKMHLKLDKLISKSVNGITIQLYASLIAYIGLAAKVTQKEHKDELTNEVVLNNKLFSRSFTHRLLFLILHPPKLRSRQIEQKRPKKSV